MKITKYGRVVIEMRPNGKPTISVYDFEGEGESLEQVVIEAQKWAYCELAKHIPAEPPQPRWIA